MCVIRYIVSSVSIYNNRSSSVWGLVGVVWWVWSGGWVTVSTASGYQSKGCQSDPVDINFSEKWLLLIINNASTMHFIRQSVCCNLLLKRFCRNVFARSGSTVAVTMYVPWFSLDAVWGKCESCCES